MTDIRHRKAYKVRPTGEVVDHTAILSFLRSTNDNIPYNNPSETACSKLAFHWLGICNFSRVICSSASYLSVDTYKKPISIRTFFNTFMNRLGLFFKKRQKKKKRKRKRKNAAQLELKIVNNIALWFLAGLQHTKLRNIVSYKTHNPRQVKNSKLKIYL